MSKKGVKKGKRGLKKKFWEGMPKKSQRGRRLVECEFGKKFWKKT